MTLMKFIQNKNEELLVTIYNPMTNDRVENVNVKFFDRWRNLGFELEEETPRVLH